MSKQPAMPKSVLIGNTTYTVRCDSELTKLERENANQEMLHGRYHSVNAQLFVAHDLTLESKQETLIHEVLHGLFWHLGFGSLLREGEDEVMVASLSTLLLRCLRDNPEFVEYVIGTAGS